MDTYFAKYLLESTKDKNNKECLITALETLSKDFASSSDSQLDGKQKNTEYSITSRKHGNRSFIAGLFAKSVEEYTQSIVHALNSSQELAIAYANRSAALFELKKYEDCLRDIDRALELNYPAGSKTKLFKRKGLCLGLLGKPDAHSAFQEALLWLDKTNLSHDKMMQHECELKTLISNPCQTAKLEENIMQYPLPGIRTQNPEIPCASDAVVIKYSTKFGRHLVATRKIKPGEVLILEKAYCLGLSYENIHTHCSYCIQRSYNLLPCKYCVHVAYCSESCKNKAWDEYHEVECSVIGLLIQFPNNDCLLVGLRMAITATQKGTKLEALKQELEQVNHNTDPRTKGFGDDGKFHSNQFRSVYSLSDNTDKRSLASSNYGACLVALAVIKLARNSKIFGKKVNLKTLKTNPNAIYLGELILRSLGICNTNIHDLGGFFGQTSGYAIGLMPVSSLLNHSCDPNALRRCYNDSQVVYAAYPIEQGEQIFDSYGPFFSYMIKSKRHEALQGRYFNCNCIACREDWPLGFETPSYKIQPISQNAKTELTRILKKLEIMSRGVIRKDNKEQMLNLMNELLKTIEKLFELAQRPCKELFLAVALLQQFYRGGDDVFKFVPSSPHYDGELPRHKLFSAILNALVS